MAEFKRKRAGKSTEMTLLTSGPSSASGIPCGACKFLRRRCVDGCVFAPHFSPEQGSAMFAEVHKLFGASNVTKLLMQLPEHCRHTAIETLVYEAQARRSDPVFGCVKDIMSLKQEVFTLHKELAMVQNQLLNNRQMAANTLQGPAQQPNPVYSHGSTASNLANDHQNAACSQPSFDPLPFSPTFCGDKEDKEEETSDPFTFVDQMFLSK